MSLTNKQVNKMLDNVSSKYVEISDHDEDIIFAIAQEHYSQQKEIKELKKKLSRIDKVIKEKL